MKFKIGDLKILKVKTNITTVGENLNGLVEIVEVLSNFKIYKVQILNGKQFHGECILCNEVELSDYEV